MGFLNPTPNVRSIRELSGLPSVITMYEGLESAVTLLRAS